MFPDGEPQLWTVGLTGALPERLPVPRAQAGAISPDGHLVAYQLVRPWETEMRNYRGGQNQPIRVLNLQTDSVMKLPWIDSRDQQPVWLGNTVYFISDRDWTNNVWAYDAGTRAVKQVTHYADFEVESVNAGAGAVAYEQAGDVHVYDPATGEDRKIAIRATGDFPVGHAPRGRCREVADRAATLANRRAGGVRGTRRHLHGADRQGDVAQPHAFFRRRGSRAGVVSRRQAHRVVQRCVR